VIYFVKVWSKGVHQIATLIENGGEKIDDASLAYSCLEMDEFNVLNI
jgi:hypothetical protein